MPVTQTLTVQIQTSMINLEVKGNWLHHIELPVYSLPMLLLNTAAPGNAPEFWPGLSLRRGLAFSMRVEHVGD